MVVELVDKATNELLIQTDWTTVLQISDILNRDPVHARSVVKQVTKKLKDRSRVIMLALELADSLLQNCECTHVYFAERTFQTELCRLIMNKKTKLNVKEKTLEIVESWGNAFSARHDLPGFYETYSFIKRSGYKFPPKPNDAPNLNFNNPPQRRTVSSSSMHNNPAQNNYSSSSPQRSSTMISPSNNNNNNNTAPNKLNQEISSIRGSTSVFNEMISFLNVEEEDPLENDLIKELFETCKQSQQRVKEMIESGGGSSSERDLNVLLKLNDEINNALKDYDACLARRKAFVDNGFKPLSPPPHSNGNNHQNNNNNNNSNRPSYLTKHKELEEIDFFKAPDGVSPFSMQPYGQPQQPVYNINFNPFAPQQQQQQQIQQQQFGYPPQQQQSIQQQPKDDFDLFLANRQQNSNPFAAMNSNNTNNNTIQPYVPSTAKSLPAGQSPFFNNNANNNNNNNNNNGNNSNINNSNTNTLPSAPPPFRPSTTQSHNPNPFSSPYNSPMYNNNSNNNNLQPNNNNSLVPAGGSYPNYNAIRNDNNDSFNNIRPNNNNNNNMNNFNQNPYAQQQQLQQQQQMQYNSNPYGMNSGFSPNSNYSQFSNYVQPNFQNQNNMMNNQNNYPQSHMYPNTANKQSLI